MEVAVHQQKVVGSLLKELGRMKGNLLEGIVKKTRSISMLHPLFIPGASIAGGPPRFGGIERCHWAEPCITSCPGVLGSY